MSLLQNSNAVTPVSGYNIDYSCRFNNPGLTDGSPGTSRLTKTMGSPTNARVWTFSIWAKRGFLGSDYGDTGVGVTSSKRFFGCKPTSGTTTMSTGWEQDNNLVFRFFDSTDTEYKLSSTARYRDPAAWYHCVFQYNSPHATSSERMKMWVNGEQITALGTAGYPPQNTLAGWNESGFISAVGTYLGNPNTPTYEYGFDGLLAEIHFVDGQALTAANFGEADEDTGQWKAIKYAGTYGNNGFFFEFKNSGALGTDTSGNGNNWATADLAATDQMIDTPQNTKGGNWSTLNSVNQRATYRNLSEGNLKLTPHDGSNSPGTATIGGVQSGKWYMEYYINTVAASAPSGVYLVGGVVESNVNVAGSIHDGTSGMPISRYMNGLGEKGYTNRNVASYGSALAAGNIVGMAVDITNGAIYWSVNNTWIDSGDPTSGATKTGAAFTDILSAMPAGGWTMFLEAAYYSGNIMTANFGQDSSFVGATTAQGKTDANGNGDFYYTPPTGYLGLCTDNLADPSIVLPEEYFNTVLWTGNGVGSRAITGVGFQPDYVWLKQVNNPTAYGHQNFDVIRGATNYLVPNTNAAENDGNPSYGDQTLLSFDSDGFSIGTSDTINENGYQVAGWNWKAGGAPSSNNDGTITSSVSVNTTSGFSIVSYTGTGSNTDSVGHGLTTVPECIVIKNLAGGQSWKLWTPFFAATQAYVLTWDTDAGVENNVSYFYNAAPTATRFNPGDGGATNGNGASYIAYCWDNIEGYSKCGTYKGNGNRDGAFAYTGFRPAYLWLKSAGSWANGHWHVFDNKRYPYNQTSNTASTGIVIDEAANTGGGGGEGCGPIDILSNGFKLRATNGNGNDASTWFIYLAFAETPFKTANAR